MNTQFRKNLPGTSTGLLRRRPLLKPSNPAPGPPALHLTRARGKHRAQGRSAIINDCLTSTDRAQARSGLPWFPARVACHDILGQTALVDLAGLRDAIAEGGDPAKVNPVVPVQLIVDHSLAVECGGFDPRRSPEEPRHRRSPQRRPLPLHQLDQEKRSRTWT